MEKLKDIAQKIKELIIPGFNMFQENKITVYSGYATLFIVTALIPFIILIISVVNLIPGYSAEDVADMLLKMLPDLEALKEMVLSVVTDVKAQSGGLLASVAAVTALWSASQGVMAIQKGLDELDSQDEEADESFVSEKEEIVEKGVSLGQSILKRIGFTLALILLFPAMILFGMLGDSTAGVVGSVLTILVALYVIIQLFAKLPAKTRTLRSQIPGAVATGIAWMIFTGLFSFFISKSYKYSTLYGSLAAVFMFLLWLRYMVMILFGGGVLNRVLEERRKNG